MEICDDCCTDKTDEEIQKILKRIARNSYPVLKKAEEEQRNNKP